MTQKYENLKDKIVVITGAGSGLGRAMAIAFASQGSYVWCLGRTEETLKETVSLAEKHEVNYKICDVSIQKEVSKIFKEILAESGKIDVLINNAASFGQTISLVDSDPEIWSALIDTNVKGPYYCTKEALPSMQKQKNGYILNISSIASNFAYTKRSGYGVSKAAIEYLSKVTAAENGHYNIISNSLALGQVKGERIDQLMRDRAKATNTDSKEMMEEFLKQYRLGTMLDPEDVVEEVLHMVGSDTGRKMTGRVVTLDCGFRL